MNGVHNLPSQPVSLRSILILFSHLCPRLASSLPSRSPTKTLYEFLSPSTVKQYMPKRRLARKFLFSGNSHVTYFDISMNWQSSKQAFSVRFRCDVPVAVGRVAGTAVLRVTLLSNGHRNTNVQFLRHDTTRHDTSHTYRWTHTGLCGISGSYGASCSNDVFVKISGEQTASVFRITGYSCTEWCSSWDERSAGCIRRLGATLVNKSNEPSSEALSNQVNQIQ